MNKESMNKGLEQYRADLAAGLVQRLTPLQKAAANPTSFRAAIDAKCYDCNGAENWAKRTKYCIITDCPLWPLRKGAKGISKEQCYAAQVS